MDAQQHIRTREARWIWSYTHRHCCYLCLTPSQPVVGYIPCPILLPRLLHEEDDFQKISLIQVTKPKTSTLVSLFELLTFLISNIYPTILQTPVAETQIYLAIDCPDSGFATTISFTRPRDTVWFPIYRDIPSGLHGFLPTSLASFPAYNLLRDICVILPGGTRNETPSPTLFIIGLEDRRRVVHGRRERVVTKPLWPLYGNPCLTSQYPIPCRLSLLYN